ncbi:Rpn family recombination-promoting nuclease/putative transposase, partial [Pigmentiphaga humi]
DMLWRVRSRHGDWVYVYLLLEFQSRSDPYMALRALTYVGLEYEDILRHKGAQGDGRLPPMLPIVLYNGVP